LTREYWKPTVNLKELARHLNLSQTTVSRALNGYPEVNEETRQRVLQAVKTTGYRPNRAAQRLATGRAGSIGLVMPTAPGRDTDLHFAEFLSGLGEVCLSEDIQLVISPSRPEDEEATFRKLAAGGTVDAIFLAYTRKNDTRIDLLRSLSLPFVVHGQTLDGRSDFPLLDIDNHGAFRDAARLLLQLGHRRIGLLNGPDYLTFAIARDEGFADALLEFDLKPDPQLTCHFSMTEENGFRGMSHLLRQDDRPTAVLCSSMVLALGAVRAVNQHGLAIGSDISLIAHDDVFPYLKPENFTTPLTTTRSSIRDAGKRIGARLIAASAGKGDDNPREIWPVDLIVRASTAPAPATVRKPLRAPAA
jgi:LacI family transcriptional regulator